MQTTIMRKGKYLIIGIIAILLTTTKSSFAEETPETLAFTVQPLNMCLQKDSACTLSCSAECGHSTIFYKWYSTNAKGTTKTPITDEWSESPDLAIVPFSEKGIRYYVCGATIDQENIVYSNVVAAAYTGLPILNIETVNHEEPTAEYYKTYTIINETKVPSRMWIYKDGEETAIYDSKDYVKKESGLTVKLRGNTSAFTPKKPYKLKLQKKDDLLANLIGRNDKKYKDKDWVLLKDGTSLKTFVGLTIADIAGTQWTPEFAYVNVIMNGIYRGVYMLIESVNQSEKRVNVADNGYIIEVDTYYWKEPFYFRTNSNRTITFKHPDEDDIEEDRELITFIKNYMDVVEDKIKDGTYEDYINTESFARWQLIHDILGSKDYKGSNIYMTKYDNTTPDTTYEDGSWSKIEMSTPWDFDGIYSMENSWAKQHFSDRNYATSLFLNQNSAFFDSYQEQWENISNNVWSELSTKLNTLKNDIGEDINISRQLDAVKWNTSYKTVEQDIATAQTWFTSRVEWINTAINGMKKVILPDFDNITIAQKTYDGNDDAEYSGNIAIKNPASITEGDDVHLHITSAKYDTHNTNAQKVVVTYELSGDDIDKYTLLDNQIYQLLDDANSYYLEDLSEYLLTSNTEEIPATILPKPYENLTITLSNTDFVYDGTAKTPTLTVKDGNNLIPSSQYLVAYTNNTDAGTATVTITDKDHGNYTVNGASTTFTIAPKPIASPSITLSETNFVYDGSAKTPSVTVKDSATIIPESEYTVSYTENITAGTASVTITDNAGGNYAISETDTTFTILPKTLETPTILLSENEFVYNGTDKKPVVVLKDGDTEIIGTEYNVTYTNNINAGTATVTLSDNEDGNYIINDTSLYFSIIRRPFTNLTIEVSGTDFVYDGTVQTPSVTVKKGDIEISDSEYNVIYTDNTNAGTATITISDNEEGNYIISESKTTFTIAKKQLDTVIIVLSKTEFTFDGSAQTPSVTVKDGETVIPESEYKLAFSDNTNAGTATVSITNNNGGNYVICDTSAVFTITKKQLDTVLIALSETEFVFDGSAQTPSVTIKDGESVIPESEYNIAIADNTNAGTAIVSITNKDGGNYVICDTSTVFTIAKKQLDTVLIALSETEFTFDGTAKTPSVTVKDGETVIPESEYTLAFADNTNSGTATVSITTNNGGNYVICDTSAVFTIAKKQLDTVLIALSETDFVFNGTAQTPSVTVKDGETVIPESEYTLAFANNTNSGTATVSITNNNGGNYVICDTSTVFTIAKKQLDSVLIALSETDFTFDGTEKTPSVTVKDGETVIPESEYTLTFADNTNAGTATVSITNNNGGNYVICDTSAVFTIAKKQLDSVLIALSETEFTFDGTAKTPSVTIKDGETVIPESEYTLAFADNTNAGTAIVSITNNNGGNYVICDTSTVFTITKKQLDTVLIALSETEYVFDGTEKTPSVTVKDGETVIPESEYTVTITDNIDAGTATVSITDNDGGNYVINDAETTFTIAPKAIDSVMVALSDTNFIYDGAAKTPTVTVKVDEMVIPESEYTINYSDNINAGTATITITDNGGNYMVSETKAMFTIEPQQITVALTLSEIEYVYSGTEKKPAITVKSGEIEISETEYSIVYTNNVNAGTATIAITDKEGGNYVVCDTSADFSIIMRPLVNLSLELSETEFVYDGTEKTPSVTVKNDESVIPESEYQVTYTNNIDAGTAKVIVTNKDGGNYLISETIAEFVINPDESQTSIADVLESGNNTKVWAYGQSIYIESSLDAKYRIVDINGRTIAVSTTKSTREAIQIDKTGIYLVQIDNKSYKVFVK